MKRRTLLTMIPAASALLATRAFAAPIPKSALSAAGFGISVQCWSFREFTLFEAIDMAAAAGMDGVEIFPGQKLGANFGEAKFDPYNPDLPEEHIQAILEHLEKNRLVAYNLGVINVPNEESRARRIFELGKKMSLYGISTEAIHSIDLLEKMAEEYDIKVCFHNHPRRQDNPDYKMWDPDFVYDSVKDRHPNMGICADIGHWATTGLDPVEVMKKVAPRVYSFHMKDRAEIGKRVPDLPFGTGIIDNVAILDEVAKYGFAGNVSIEYERNWLTNVPEVAQSAGYLRCYSKIRASERGNLLG
jgi:sugar phosphate isomerase/epimerase